MAMQVGSARGKGPAPDMNVTPLVDVVLVLLIIFMVMTPLANKKFWVHTPQHEKQEVEKKELVVDPEPPLVLRVEADATVKVNGTVVPFDELPVRLRRMFAAREDHILFFDAADDAPYGFTVQAMDRAREGGAVTIATLTTALQADPAAVAAPGDPAGVSGP